MHITDEFGLFPFGLALGHFDSSLAYDVKCVAFSELSYDKLVICVVKLYFNKTNV